MLAGCTSKARNKPKVLKYRPRRGACGLLLSCPRQSRAPPFLAGLSGLDALRVQKRRTRRLSYACPLAHLGDTRLVGTLPCSTQAPAAVVDIDRAPRWQMVWQLAPLAAGLEHVKDRINNLAPVGTAWSPCFLLAGRLQQRSQQLPLLIRQIALIALPCHQRHQQQSLRTTYTLSTVSKGNGLTCQSSHG